jgi:DNA-binding GntR family transcriptional regulator
MWKKAYIRLMFVAIMAVAGLAIASAWRPASTASARECTDSQEQSRENKNQGDFMVWESLNRTVLNAIQF